jgi:hypothetical protein
VGIDWGVVVASLAAPLFAFAINEQLRPKLIAWYVHSSAVPVQRPPEQGGLLTVHSHAVVVRNSGRRTATNVTLGHYYLPLSFGIFPAFRHTVIPPGGGKDAEIIFPTVVPGGQVTITYLYFPPLVWNGVNSYIRSSEGMGRFLTVVPAPLLPKWGYRLVAFALFLGIAAAVYGVIEFVLWVVGRL